MHWRLLIGLACCCGLISCTGLRAVGLCASEKPAHPQREGHWLRPSELRPAQPVWGHADGLQVGLAPMPGPRGLLRVYAPYLGHGPGRMINFIAVEPIVDRRRGFSELEHSRLDGARGKRFWSANTPSDFSPRAPDHPARGVITRSGTIETLQVYVLVEPFDNGARPYLRLRFRADRPYEVELATFSRRDSAPMKTCVLTATMGNYARLRRIQLAGRVVHSTDLWPSFQGDGFAPARRFPLAQLQRSANGDVIVAATTDERTPAKASYAPDTFRGWKYEGRRAVQYWRGERPPKDLFLRVNGRGTYWASRTPIPGGISFENFELVAPFRSGQQFWFGVKPAED